MPERSKKGRREDKENQQCLSEILSELSNSWNRRNTPYSLHFLMKHCPKHRNSHWCPHQRPLFPSSAPCVRPFWSETKVSTGLVLPSQCTALTVQLPGTLLQCTPVQTEHASIHAGTFLCPFIRKKFPLIHFLLSLNSSLTSARGLGKKDWGKFDQFFVKKKEVNERCKSVLRVNEGFGISPLLDDNMSCQVTRAE